MESESKSESKKIIRINIIFPEVSVAGYPDNKVNCGFWFDITKSVYQLKKAISEEL